MMRARSLGMCLMALALAACSIDDLKVQEGEAGQGGSTPRAGRTGSAGKPAAEGGKSGGGASPEAGKGGSDAGKGGAGGRAGSGGRISAGAGAAAAGAGGSGGSGVSAELMTAVSQYVDMQCAKIAQCVPWAFETGFLSDMQRCRTRWHLQYDWVAALPATGWTASKLAGCRSAQEALTCRQYIDDVGQPECQVAGMRQNGEPCNVRDQCASRFCGASSNGCGACAAAPALGASCDDDSDCPDMASCVCPDGSSSCAQTQCLRRAGEGAACGVGSPCNFDLNCGTDNRCHAPPDQAGATCSAVGEVACDLVAKGLACSANGTCQKLTAADTCSETTFCRQPGSVCHADTGVCDPPPTDGGACSANGSCLYPAGCVSGKCVLPSDVKICQ
jgi:hypothetical protein